MIEVNNDFKLKSKKVKQQDVKVTVGEERHKIKQLVYSFDGALFKTIMKQVEITDKTANQLKDKDINFKYGLYINDAFQYIDLGNFYIKDMEDDKKKEEITVTGYDRMIRFMKTFKQSELQLTYPCTIIRLVQKMCEVCEVGLYSTNFFNSDLVVKEDFFTAQELTYRDVLEKIAQTTLTTVFIKENKLYFCKPSNVVSQQLDKSYISNLVVKEKFGPLNALVLGRGSVEDNVESIDEESINQNGRCEIRFDENEFVQEQRETVIDNMFEQIKGLEYYSYEASDLGVMWLEPCDCIELGDRDGNFYKTYYLKANITLTTGISSDSEAEMPDEADTKYKVTSKAEKKTLKVERLAKKNEGLIQDLIEENSETSETLSRHEQTLDGFTNTVSKIEKDVESVKSTANSSVKKVEVKYALGDSSKEAPATGWNTTAPTWTEGKYMWQKTVTTFVDGSVSESNATCIQGAKGADGTDGKDGKDGVNGEKGEKGDPGDSGISAYMHVKYSDDGKRFTAPINNLISMDVNSWENGHYSMEAGEKQDWNNRIRLKELLPVPIAPGRYITDTRYDSLNGQSSEIDFVIRCYDKNKNFVLSIGGNKNGRSIYVRTDIAYLGISLYSDDSSIIISTENLQNLVNDGLEAIFCKEDEYILGEKAGPYIGILSSNTSVPSTTFDDYTWTEIKGEKGDTGDKGETGKSGTDGNGIKKIDYYYATTTTQTAPTASNITSTSIPKLSETNKYLWRKEVITFTTTTTPQTTITLLAIYGDKGIAGDKGADGKTTYFHIKYSSVANPTPSQMTETPSAYIGTYVDYTAEDSTDPAKYTWSRFQGIQGEKGEKGIPGVDGTNGKTSYLHIAYANSADGKTDFNVSDSTNKTYIGQYTDFIEADSADPTKYSWTKIKGEVGEQGKTGATGKGIKSVQDQYYLSKSNTKQTDGVWKNTQDEWQEGYYIWTRSFITWTDNTTSYTTPVLADGINKANQTASDTAKNLESNYSTTKETETMIKQESDSIRLEVDTIEKFTRDITSRRELHLVDTADYAENLVLTLKIYGDTEEWKELAPSTSLAPGLTVAPLGTTIDLIVDSQSRLNPSEDKQVFTINYGKKLRSLGNVRDELDIINNKVTIIRRIGLNDSGQEYVLQTEQTEELGELKLPTLKDNTYIYVREYPNLEYFCRYITDNEYIKKFATQEGLKEATVNLNTKIEQSNKEIILLARQKVGKDEIIASINISPEEIKILAEKLQISAENVLNILAGNTINLTSRNLIIASKYLNIDEDGNLILNSPGINVFRVKNSRYPNRSIYINDQYIGVNTDGEENCITIGPINDNEGEIELSGNGRSILRASGLTTPTVTQTSTESTKKNFEILKKATDIVKNGDIYGYNLKIENDTDKKHYGFVIADEGGNFKTPEEVISKTGKGIDTYSMISVLWKACQELIIKVEQLENNMK